MQKFLETPGGMMLRRLVPALILIALALGLSSSILIDMTGLENRDIARIGLTILGILIVLPLFAITATRLNRTHQALERSETRYRELIALASDGIFVADLDGRFTEVNEAGCRLLGCSQEEIVGKTIMDFILPEDKERLLSDRERFLKGDTDVGEWMLRRKDGTYVPVEVSAKILPDGRWIAIDRDISGRKRAEEALAQALERWYLALKGADLATWDWSVKTGEVVFNTRWAEMRGFQIDEVKPHVDSCLSSMHPDDKQAALKAMTDCLEGRQPEFACEYRVATKSGDWVWVLDRGKVFERDDNGHPVRMVGTELDVTARKQTEETLRLSETAARQAARARDDMLGIVAHDLRNPLAAIATLAEVLQANGSDREVAGEIAHAVGRMNRMIRDLVDVTLLEAGTFAIKQDQVSSSDLLAEVLNSQTPLAASMSLTISIDSAPDLPAISADHDRILRVFENLVGNAIKFSKPGGQITLVAKMGAGEVLFSVADTGCGIQADQLPHVFDRFWQAPADKRQGAGLGLAIVKGIVAAHGGRVWVQSSPGQGSTFFFTISVAPQAVRAA